MRIELKARVPVPKYKDLEETRRDILSMCLYADKERTYDRDYFPCFHCGGRGEVRDPEDRDPVEGYKLAPWHPCPHCCSSGETSKEKYEAIFEHEMSVYESTARHHKILQNELERLVSKVDEHDVHFILEHVHLVESDEE